MVKQKVYLLPKNLCQFRNLPNYFNGTIILTFFVPLFSAEPFSFCLNINKTLLPGKLLKGPASFKSGSSLQYCHKLCDFFE